MKKAYLEIRSQKSKGNSVGRFGGPDTYVAVQIVPNGTDPLQVLNYHAAHLRGIEIRRFGEGYHEHTGPNSMLGRAIREARKFVEEFNDSLEQYE